MSKKYRYVAAILLLISGCGDNARQQVRDVDPEASVEIAGETEAADDGGDVADELVSGRTEGGTETAFYLPDEEQDEVEVRRPFDEDGARDAARGDIRSGQFQRYSRGYACTENCEGHEAGFDWARDNRVRRRSNCYTGDSQSFDEGCEAYVKAIDREIDERRARYEAGDDDADRY